MADAEHPTLALTARQLSLLEQRLKQLHGEAGAECAFIADLNGNMVSRAGMTVGFDLDTLALFVSKWFHAAGQVGWYLGDSTAFDLSYHDGAWYDLYAVNIGSHLFLTLIFAKTSQPSKIGMVWVLARRAVRELLPLVEAARRMASEPEKTASERETRAATSEPASPVSGRVEFDELEQALLEVAEDGEDDLFGGISYDQARELGLVDLNPNDDELRASKGR